MDIRKIYAALLIMVLISLLSSLLCLIYEVPCLLMIRFGGSGGIEGVIHNLRSLKFVFGSGEAVLSGVFVLLRLAVLGLLFRLCSVLAGRFLVPFYLRFYQVLFCLLFFLPALLLYAWVLFPGVNFTWFVVAAVALPAVVIFLFVAAFREIRKSNRAGTGMNIDLLVNEEEPAD